MIDIVLAQLPLNTKQEIIMHEIIYHTMYNLATPRPNQSYKLLLIVRGKNGVGKSQVIKAIN